MPCNPLLPLLLLPLLLLRVLEGLVVVVALLLADCAPVAAVAATGASWKGQPAELGLCWVSAAVTRSSFCCCCCCSCFGESGRKSSVALDTTLRLWLRLKVLHLMADALWGAVASAEGCKPALDGNALCWRDPNGL